MPKPAELAYIEYQELGGQSEDQETRKIQRVEWTSALVLLLLFSAAINTGVWFCLLQIPRDALDEDWNHCGRSSAEAIRRNCVMEPLIYGWMPPQCVYPDLTRRYPVFEDRKWYREQELINEIHLEFLENGTHNKVYTRVYHAEHCLFLWRKLMFALDQNEPYIDNKTISLAHTGHCASKLTDERESGGWKSGGHTVNEVVLGFYQCRNTPGAR